MFWWQHLLAIWLIANMIILALLAANPRALGFIEENTGDEKRTFKETFDAAGRLAATPNRPSS